MHKPVGLTEPPPIAAEQIELVCVFRSVMEARSSFARSLQSKTTQHGEIRHAAESAILCAASNICPGLS